MDIVTLAAARKGGGSGGDVTRQYVDEHLALKADKTETAEYPISSTTTGINPTITDSADGYVQGLTVYGRSDVSKNLFDSDDMEQGAISSAEGQTYDQNKTSSVTRIRFKNLLPIDATKTYTLSVNSLYDCVVQAYNANGLGYTIQGVTNVWGKAVTFTGIPNIAVAVRYANEADITPSDASGAQIQLELGSEPTPYEPYFSGIHGIGEDGEVDAETCGKNLFDKTKITNNALLDWDGASRYTTEIPSDGYYVTDYIPVYAGKTIHIPASGTARRFLYNLDKTIREYLNSSSDQNLTVSNDGYIRVSYYKSVVSADNLQIELGSTPTTYEPYKTPTTATVTTGIPLYSVGDVKDELDEKKGVVIKRCEKVVFDGSEDWQYTQSPYETNSKIFQCTIVRAIPLHDNDTPGNLICAELTNLSPRQVQSAWLDNCICIGNQNSQNAVFVRIEGIFDAATLKTYLASNPVTVVYELAEPYEIPLTASELSALRNLRTYDSTTNVTVTDAPTSTIGYLLNTGNGQAVADVQQGLQGQISNIPAWLTSIPENHKCIYRGKYLGNSVSAAQLTAIADGSFDDLYVGDYWTIPVTIDNVEQSVKWRIADIDYFIGYRDAVDTTKRMTTHHLVIVPDTMLYKSQLGNRSNGYNGSGIRTSGLDKAKTAINTAFPNMVLSHKNYISTAIDSNGTVTQCEEQTCTIELMSEVMVFGFNRFQQVANQQGNVYYSLGGQFALFSLCPKWKSHNAEEPIIPISGYMLQDPCYASSSEYWTGAWTLRIGPVLYTNDLGVRPYFLLGDAGT